MPKREAFLTAEGFATGNALKQPKVDFHSRQAAVTDV
jgi:hypothetical protein